MSIAKFPEVAEEGRIAEGAAEEEAGLLRESPIHCADELSGNEEKQNKKVMKVCMTVFTTSMVTMVICGLIFGVLYYCCHLKDRLDLNNYHPSQFDGYTYLSRAQYDEMHDQVLGHIVEGGKVKNSGNKPLSFFDAGAGSGGVFYMVAKKWPHIRNFGGVDYDADRLARAYPVMMKFFPECDIDHLREADMTKTPWPRIPDESYDYVTSVGAAGVFVSNSQMKDVVKEMLRIGKPGARFAISMLCGENCQMQGYIKHLRNPEWWTETFFPENKYFDNQVLPESIEIFKNIKYQKDR